MERTYSLSELPEIASMILEQTNSKILLFYGSMGVGKTTLIKELSKQLGVEEGFSSPTFSLVNEYETKEGDLVYHFDFYRLKNEEEALDIGFEEYLSTNFWILIEWPENVVGLLPQNVVKLKLTNNQDNTRTITISPMK